MQKFKLIFLFLFTISFVNAQPTLDTIKTCLKQRPRPFASIGSRNSFIDHNIVNFFSAKAGINYGKRLKLGIGYNQLYNPPKSLNQDIEYINAFGKPYIISKGLKLFYFSATFEYSFYQTKHWELSMPLQIGIGDAYYQYWQNGVKMKSNAHVNFIYEPTICINYKLTRWFGVEADYGYRFFICDTKKLNQQLNSPIVTFGISIYWSEVYKSLFPNSKLAGKL